MSALAPAIDTQPTDTSTQPSSGTRPNLVQPTDATTPTSVRQSLTWWMVGGALVVLVLVLLVAYLAPGSNQGVRDAASVLLLISGTAVGIERILEVFWDFIDTTRGSFWPLSAIDRRINQLVDGITADVSGPISQLKDILNDATKAASFTEAQASAFQRDVDALRAHIAELKRLAPTSDNARAMAAYTNSALDSLANKYPQAKLDIAAANSAVKAVSDFANSLTDNPGRRILSIYFGALLGLVVALVLGLDMFNATLGTLLETTLLGVTFKFGVTATGVIMGLGSNPTHEAIKVLQSIKEKQQY
jgi:hypothetical protein